RGTRPPADPLAAGRSLEQAALLWEKLIRAQPTARELRNDLAGIYGFLGELQLDFRQEAAAFVCLGKAGDLWEQLAQENPSTADYRANLAGCRNRVGDLLRRTGKPLQAEKAFRQGLDLWEELAARFPARADYRMELAEAFGGRGRHFTVAGKYADA